MSDITGPLRKRNCTPEGVPAGPVWEMNPRWDTSGILGIFRGSFPGVALIAFAYPALPAVIPAGMGMFLM